MVNDDSFFAIIQPTYLSEELSRHFHFMKRFFEPLHRSGAVQAMTKMTLRKKEETGLYPWYSFTHEDGTMHVFFENDLNVTGQTFRDKIVDLLIDKGEYVEKVPKSLMKQYEETEKQLEKIGLEIKKEIWKAYKKDH